MEAGPTEVAQAPKSAAEVGGPEQSPSKTKIKKKSKPRKKGKPGKIHIRLPSIESYQKEICFPAEAPGRVVVRLERLMGSDKIRPVDEKYMSTLIERLEEEENFRFERKIRLRKKAERERHRQLAIDGLMDPGPGMEDLYNHPVFRVNRILRRIAQLDSSFTNKPGDKLPPISKIDPFRLDDTGKYFCDYPTHVALRKQWERYKLDDEKLHADVLPADLDAAGKEFAQSTSYADFVKKRRSNKQEGPLPHGAPPPPPSVASVPVDREGTDGTRPPPSVASVPVDQEEEDEVADEPPPPSAVVSGTAEAEREEEDEEETDEEL